jgi:hypothetical protein
MSLLTWIIIIVIAFFLLFAIRLRKLTLGIIFIILFFIAGVLLNAISGLIEILSVVIAIAILTLVVMLFGKK